MRGSWPLASAWRGSTSRRPENAEGALGWLSNGAFDLAVVDLMMPGINGIQLARTLREQHPKTRVVLMSAYHLSERQLLRADCGAVGFVPKPFDLSELARFLRSKLTSLEPDAPTTDDTRRPVGVRGAAA